MVRGDARRSSTARWWRSTRRQAQLQPAAGSPAPGCAPGAASRGRLGDEAARRSSTTPSTCCTSTAGRCSRVPLEERKSLLRRVVREHPQVRYLGHVIEHGEDFAGRHRPGPGGQRRQARARAIRAGQALAGLAQDQGPARAGARRRRLRAGKGSHRDLGACSWPRTRTAGWRYAGEVGSGIDAPHPRRSAASARRARRRTCRPSSTRPACRGAPLVRAASTSSAPSSPNGPPTACCARPRSRAASRDATRAASRASVASSRRGPGRGPCVASAARARRTRRRAPERLRRPRPRAGAGRSRAARRPARRGRDRRGARRARRGWATRAAGRSAASRRAHQPRQGPLPAAAGRYHEARPRRATTRHRAGHAALPAPSGLSTSIAGRTASGEAAFWQKQIPSHAPDWVRAAGTIPEAGHDQSHTYVVADRVATMAWLANQAVIDMHPWTSRLPDYRRPTYALIDIDPGERTTWPEVLVLARLYRTALEHLGVPASPKVTGKRGIQVWIPVQPRYTFDETRDWVGALSRGVGRVVPDLGRWEWGKADRAGRARLDYTQNTPIKTLVAPYAVRPVASAASRRPSPGTSSTTGPAARPLDIGAIVERVAERRRPLHWRARRAAGLAAARLIEPANSVDGLTDDRAEPLRRRAPRIAEVDLMVASAWSEAALSAMRGVESLDRRLPRPSYAPTCMTSATVTLGERLDPKEPIAPAVLLRRSSATRRIDLLGGGLLGDRQERRPPGGHAGLEQRLRLLDVAPRRRAPRGEPTAAVTPRLLSSKCSVYARPYRAWIAAVERGASTAWTSRPACRSRRSSCSGDPAR